jgi:hypothetical protein
MAHCPEHLIDTFDSALAHMGDYAQRIMRGEGNRSPYSADVSPGAPSARGLLMVELSNIRRSSFDLSDELRQAAKATQQATYADDHKAICQGLCKLASLVGLQADYAIRKGAAAD